MFKNFKLITKAPFKVCMYESLGDRTIKGEKYKDFRVLLPAGEYDVSSVKPLLYGYLEIENSGYCVSISSTLCYTGKGGCLGKRFY